MTDSIMKYKRALNIKSFNPVLYTVMGLLMMAILTSCNVSKEPASVADTGYGQTSEHTDKGNELLNSGDIDGAAVEFREAMKLNPKDTMARLGAAKVQIKRESYDLAKDSLETAILIEPDNRELYETYKELCVLSGDIDYGQDLSDLARTNKQQWFIDEYVPEAPVANIKSGSYNQIQELDFQNIDGAEIVLDIENDYNKLSDVRYKKPYTLRRGETNISAYSVKNGIPSESVEYEFSIDYDPIEVEFEDAAFEKAIREHLGFDDEEEIYDIDLETIIELDDVNGYEYKVHSLNDLKWMTNLEVLRLFDQHEITDWEGLLDTNIIELDLLDCNISDVSFLSDNIMLEGLNLENNNISDISSLAKLTNLTYIDIHGNPVTDISPLSQLEYLDDIGLDGNQSSGLEQFKNFNNIRYLRITNGVMFDVNLLKNMKKLYYLRLDSCGLTDISFLSGLSELKYLYLNNNDITDLTSLSGLEKLKTLYLSNNKNLSDISPVCGIISLERIGINGTSVPGNLDLTFANPNCEIKR
ncbi:leucine-rich repeat domain-containing protein [Oribacterium sp. FC2011]|uniref:leucine-rich repeat domain-containing protein n=1 Tax=Oribacterium sp. FC2011 TaxID=1408311 RepID=UPI0004E25CEA|nr:leucine-rich repeat domain-containing protein [Oribacterium sp. FC2011]